MDEDEKALLFTDVKFIIAQCHHLDEIKKILIDGGAKHINYLSEHVTLVIADINCPEAEEAVDLYDKPVVNSLWVYLSLKAKKLLPTEAFSPIKNIFNNVVASISPKLSRRDSDILVATLTFYGAKVSKHVFNSTHFIVTATNDLENLPNNAPSELKIVAPDWVLDSVKSNNCCDEQLFDPNLLLPPPPPTPSPPPPPPKEPTPPPPQVIIKEKETPITPNIIANQLKKPTPNNQPQKSIISLPKSRPQDGPLQQQQQQLNNQQSHQQPQQQYYQRQYPQQNFYQNPQQGQSSPMQRPPTPQTTHVVQTGPVQVANTRQQFRPNLVANTTPQQVRPARNLFYNQQQKPTHVPPQHPQDSMANQQQYHIQQQPQTPQQQQYYQRPPSQQNFRPSGPQSQSSHVLQPPIQSTHPVQSGPVQTVSRPQYQPNLMPPVPGPQQIRGPRTFYNPQQRPRAPVPQHSQDPITNNQQYHTQQQQQPQAPQQQQYYPRHQYPQQNFPQTSLPPTNQQLQQSTSHPTVIQSNTNQMSTTPPLTIRPQFQQNLSTSSPGPQQVRVARNLFYNQNHDSAPQGNIRITNPNQVVIQQAQNPRIPNSSIVSNQVQNQPQTQPKPHPSIFDHIQESNLANIKAKVPIVNENIEYFGHDPKENVPKNLPFIGCRFGLIDYEEVDLKKKERWRETIKTAGGMFEEDIKNMTHLICENRESELFKEALKLGIRCVTIYWINDILGQNRLSYPWKALHIPVAFPKNRKPLTSEHLISVTNSKGKERREIRDMILMTGARYTEHFSARNFLLVCGNVGGDKYEHAVEWKTPIANCHLISDLLLNSDRNINLMLTQSKYQLFNTSDHLRLNSYSEVRELMKAWLKPIVVGEQRSTINGDIGRSLQPTTNSDDSGIATTDDNCTNVEIKNSSEETQKNERSLRKSIEPVRLLFTHLNSNLVEKLKSYAMELGLGFADSPISCTHLIVDRISRTPKFICAFSHAKYILDYKWIIESHEVNDLLDEKHFILQDKAGEEKYLFNLVYSWLKRKKRNGLLFSNLIFFVTPSVISEVSNVKEMIESAGGVVSTKKAPSKMQLDQIKSDGKRLVVVSCDKDQYLCSTLETLGVDIVDVEFVITGILRQDIDYESHRLKKTQSSFVRPDTNTSIAQISASPTKKLRLEESSC